MILSVNISDIAIIAVKNVDYRCIIYNSKFEAIKLLKYYVLEVRGYITKNIALIFRLLQTVFLTFFILVYIKWLIVNIVWTSLNL